MQPSTINVCLKICTTNGNLLEPPQVMTSMEPVECCAPEPVCSKESCATKQAMESPTNTVVVVNKPCLNESVSLSSSRSSCASSNAEVATLPCASEPQCCVDTTPKPPSPCPSETCSISCPNAKPPCKRVSVDESLNRTACDLQIEISPSPSPCASDTSTDCKENGYLNVRSCLCTVAKPKPATPPKPILVTSKRAGSKCTPPYRSKSKESIDWDACPAKRCTSSVRIKPALKRKPSVPILTACCKPKATCSKPKICPAQANVCPSQPNVCSSQSKSCCCITKPKSCAPRPKCCCSKSKVCTSKSKLSVCKSKIFGSKSKLSGSKSKACCIPKSATKGRTCCPVAPCMNQKPSKSDLVCAANPPCVNVCCPSCAQDTVSDCQSSIVEELKRELLQRLRSDQQSCALLPFQRPTPHIRLFPCSPDSLCQTQGLCPKDAGFNTRNMQPRCSTCWAPL
ncbi:hypothetical protein KR222_007811 [Zaprionus bogoriensis]|nr:hypothetical protein KR222_007811 [Zaprionus bogoriensis]